MTQYEPPPLFERPCATCLNRPKVSQALAMLGLFSSGENCPGADVIDRFKVVKVVGAEPFPEDSGDHSSLTGDFASDTLQPTIEYFQQEHSRTKSCPKDSIPLRTDEKVIMVRVNDKGKVWAKIARGSSENIRKLQPLIDRHLLNDDPRPPLEILRSVRLVTIINSQDNIES